MTGSKNRTKAGHKDIKMASVTSDDRREPASNAGSSSSKNVRPIWDISREAMNNVNQTLEAHQKFLNEMVMKWSSRSVDPRAFFGQGTVPTETLEKVGKAWNIYQTEMNALLTKMMGSGNGSLVKLNDKWLTLSSKMNDVLLSLGRPSTAMPASVELMTTWVEISKATTEVLSRASVTNAEAIGQVQAKMSVVMRELWDSIAVLPNAKGLPNGLDDWRSYSEEFNEDLNAYLARSYQWYSMLGALFTKSAIEMGNSTTNASKTIGDN